MASFPSLLEEAPEGHPRQVSFEFERVRIVLRRFGLAQHIPDMVARFQKKWGQKRLTFETFYEFFPSFPVLLEARSFYRVSAHCKLVTLFRHFDSTFIFQKYLEVFTRSGERAGGRPIGMAFPFGGYTGGLIIHNSTSDTRGFRWVYDMPGDVAPYRVTVEPFVAFVRSLAKGGWTPKSPFPQPGGTQGARLRRGCWLRPWVVRLLGITGDAVLLCWLLRVLRLDPRPYERIFLEASGGARCVVVNHSQLAKETGLSERQVKRGLRRLRELGLIGTRPGHHRGQPKTWISLDREAVRSARRDQTAS